MLFVAQVLYSPAAYGVDLSSQNAPKPRARINANMCVVKNTLWLFGGIVEIGDKEVWFLFPCTLLAGVNGSACFHYTLYNLSDHNYHDTVSLHQQHK